MRRALRSMMIQIIMLCQIITLVGCSAMPTATPVSDHPGPEESIPLAKGPSYFIPKLEPMGFAQVKADIIPSEAKVPDYTTDPSAALNSESVKGFLPEEEEFLTENGFVIMPEGSQQIYDIYKQKAKAGIPLFVTTDALLHTYHILYDYTLRYIEYDQLVVDLQKLLQLMIDATQRQHTSAKGIENLEEAATQNLAFFSVALRLLNPENETPSSVRDLVDAEIVLVEKHKGFSESPIFGYAEDYSQYVPRGHYTRNETFRRYFRAMMWLGRMMFRLRPGDSAEAIEAGRRETRQALLIAVTLLNEKAGDEIAIDIWERIYEPTAFFVGKSDDLSVHDYHTVLRQVFGDNLDLFALAKDTEIDRFIDTALSLRPPKIVSSYVTDQEKPSSTTKGFRFMGQRFVPDSYIFQQLVYDKIGAVLGSERALEILETEGDAAYEGYGEQMSNLRREFADLPGEQWAENLYWNWLHTLRPMLKPKGEGYPVFMRTSSWLDKGLNAFLGSWAELRHDTILYAKQSYTLRATSMRPERPKLRGYVEPEIEVWNRLLCLIRQMHEGLSSRHLLNDEFERRLSQMENLVESLRDIAEKELLNKPLSEEEAAIIERIGGTLEGITTFSEKVKGEITSQADERMAIVADVHTDVNSGQVLEEGVGDPFAIYVIVPHGGETVICVGGVFSHYEFKQPMDQRLTDEEWQKMGKPPLAPWISELVKQ